MPFTTERNLKATGDVIFDPMRAFFEILQEMIPTGDRLSQDFLDDMHSGNGYMVDVLNSRVLDTFENDLKKAGVEYAFVERAVPTSENAAILKKSIIFREQDLAYVELARAKANALSKTVHVLTPLEFKHTFEGKESGKISNLTEIEYAYIRKKALDDNKIICAEKEQKETGIGRKSLNYTVKVVSNDIKWLRDTLAKVRFIDRTDNGHSILESLTKVEKDAAKWVKIAASLDPEETLYVASERYPNKYMIINSQGYELHIRTRAEDVDRMVGTASSKESNYSVKLFKTLSEELMVGTQISEKEAAMNYEDKIKTIGGRIEQNFGDSIYAAKAMHYLEALHEPVMQIRKAKTIVDETKNARIKEINRILNRADATTIDHTKKTSLMRERHTLQTEMADSVNFMSMDRFEAQFIKNPQMFFGLNKYQSGLTGEQLDQIKNAFEEVKGVIETFSKESPQFQKEILTDLAVGIQSVRSDPVAEREIEQFTFSDQISQIFEKTYISEAELNSLIDKVEIDEDISEERA